MKQTLKFLATRLWLFLFVFVLTTVSLHAQQSPPSLDTSSPGAFLSDNNLSLIWYALNIMFSYVLGLWPKLARFNGYLRTAGATLLMIGVFAIFKKDALNLTTLEFFANNFLSLLLGSVAGYETIKNILRLFGIDIKSKK